MTNGSDGGMMGPSVAEAAVTPTENSLLYPWSRIALISIVPRPAASAIAVPDMPAKITEPTMLTCPSPPFIQPTSASAKL